MISREQFRTSFSSTSTPFWVVGVRSFKVIILPYGNSNTFFCKQLTFAHVNSGVLYSFSNTLFLVSADLHLSTHIWYKLANHSLSPEWNNPCTTGALLLTSSLCQDISMCVLWWLRFCTWKSELWWHNFPGVGRAFHGSYHNPPPNHYRLYDHSASKTSIFHCINLFLQITVYTIHYYLGIRGLRKQATWIQKNCLRAESLKSDTCKHNAPAASKVIYRRDFITTYHTHSSCVIVCKTRKIFYFAVKDIIIRTG